MSTTPTEAVASNAELGTPLPRLLYRAEVYKDRGDDCGRLARMVLHALRWIPITERLPEKNTEVLIAFAGQCAIPATGQYTGSAFDSHGWCYPAENRGSANDGEDPVVTHWMALPEVPN
jgi:hypothetical protein